jgi:hypothetical protein
MLYYRRVFARAIVLLALCTATSLCFGGNTPRTIKEGVGWEKFTLGASANSLVDLLGFPDKRSRGRMMNWEKSGLNCLLNDQDEAIELRFEKRSKAVTESGVRFGMSADQVRKIYGDAGKMEFRGGGMKLIWPSRGVLIWFHDNAVYQIVIFKAKT